jgi:hypothetical protein
VVSDQWSVLSAQLRRADLVVIHPLIMRRVGEIICKHLRGLAVQAEAFGVENERRCFTPFARKKRRTGGTRLIRNKNSSTTKQRQRVSRALRVLAS